jgi:NhaA family Na+:H+ antiporter
MQSTPKPDAQDQPVQRLLRPFQEFAQAETSAGFLVLLSILVALVWANSPWSASYLTFWRTPFAISLGPLHLSKPLVSWINDGFMVIFFLVVGLEVKRELLGGELASPKRAALPLAAALGGMLLPAGIYLAFNAGSSSAAGWGIPMATDIALVLGVLTLLGKRASQALKVFLTALAIIDDLGAIFVITIFYHPAIQWTYLAVGVGLFLILIAINWGGVHSLLPYMLLGGGLWLAILGSGVHATLAGILVAMTIPEQRRIDPGVFLRRTRGLLHMFEEMSRTGNRDAVSREEQETLRELEAACGQVEAPLQRLERLLHPWVVFGIVPLFVLANAGVTLGGEILQTWTHPVSLGVLLGLVLGKQLGITFFAWGAVKINWAELSAGLTWWHIYGVGWLAGLGFTMSLFIAHLAFDDLHLLTMVELGLLFAAVIAGIVGSIILRVTSKGIAEVPESNEQSLVGEKPG